MKADGSMTCVPLSFGLVRAMAALSLSVWHDPALLSRRVVEQYLFRATLPGRPLFACLDSPSTLTEKFLSFNSQ